MNSDPVGAIESRTDHKWYIHNIDHRITPDIRDLLENYSQVPHNGVRQHIYNIREKAWAIRPYPCTGLGGFLDPMIARSPAYSVIISRLQQGESLLDVGCFIGHDLRKLVFDGAPSTNLYAVDILNHWDLGYEFFRDADRFSAKFMETDILNPNKELKSLEGRIDIISVTHVLHQWDWDGQVVAAKKLVSFSRPGTLIVGYQGGGVTGRKPDSDKLGADYRARMHNPESWKQMWVVVGESTGTKWKFEASLKTWTECGYRPEETAYLGEDARMLEFVVTRVE